MEGKKGKRIKNKRRKKESVVSKEGEKRQEKTAKNRVRFLLLFISGLEERERVALLGQSGSRQSKQKYGFEARRKATRH